MRVFAGTLLLSAATIPVWSVDRAPSVCLNHLNLVLDDATYSDLAGSSFLRDNFAGSAIATTAANGGESWSGIYLYGEHTYVEFFSAKGARKGREVGDSAIGFGVEEEGGAHVLAEALRQSFGAHVQEGVRTKVLAGEEFPWFKVATIVPADGHPMFSDWVMEYDPGFMKHRYADLQPEEDGITRRQYLERSFRNDRLLGDVDEVDVALAPARADLLLRELRIFGYTVLSEGRETTLQGPDIRIRLVVQTGTRSGVVGFGMRLLRDVGSGTTYRFGGGSTLTLRGRAGRWDFR